MKYAGEESMQLEGDVEGGSQCESLLSMALVTLPSGNCTGVVPPRMWVLTQLYHCPKGGFTVV